MTEPPLPPSPVVLGDINPLEAPLGVGDVLDGAFRLYRANFGRMLLSATVVLAPLGILSAGILGPTQATQLSTLQAILRQRGAFDAASLDGGPPLPVLALCVYMPLQFLATLFARLVLTQQAVDALRGRTRRLGERLGIALKRLPSYTAMGCIMWLVIGIVVVGLGMAGAVAAGVALAAVAAAGSGAGVAGIAAAVVGLGIVAMVGGVGGAALYLAGRWVAALPILVLESPDPIAALGRSWQLTARRPWRAMGFVAILYLLTNVLATIVATPLYMASILMPPSSVNVLGMAIQALSAVITILIVPLWAAALVVYYHDLRLRDERVL